MTLHMVHAFLNMRSFRRWAWDRGLVRNGSLDEGYALHILLSGMFGKAVLQPFRLFASEHRSSAGLYGYTETRLEELRRIAASVAPPDSAAALDPARMKARAMPARFAEAQRVAFDVRVRPVRRLQCDRTDPTTGTVTYKKDRRLMPSSHSRWTTGGPLSRTRRLANRSMPSGWINAAGRRPVLNAVGWRPFGGTARCGATVPARTGRTRPCMAR